MIVTGGSRGIGLAIVRALADSGYHVIAVARRDSAALSSAMREATQTTGGAIHFRPCDLAAISTLPTLIRGLHQEFGPIYGLVNNAGIGASGVLATLPDNELESLIRLNVLSPIMVTKYVVRAMMDSGGSRVVNITSIVGSTGYSGLAAYAATKSALIGFTRSLARELGPLGITVNAVAPGFIETEMTSELKPEHREQICRRSALRRMPNPTDIAAAVLFLFSEAARNMTGTLLTVDAGNTA